VRFSRCRPAAITAAPFASIPFGRGLSRSVPMDEVFRAACRLSDKGFREIVLTGVDLTSYGADLCGGPRLGELVKSILRAAPKLERLRLSSIDCIEADADLIDAFATEPRLMPHLPSFAAIRRRILS